METCQARHCCNRSNGAPCTVGQTARPNRRKRHRRWHRLCCGSPNSAAISTASMTTLQGPRPCGVDFLPCTSALRCIASSGKTNELVFVGKPQHNGAGTLPVAATLGAIEPGSLEVEWNTFTDEAVPGAHTFAQLQEMGIAVSIWRDPTQIARDDGNGGVVLNGISIGTVNYATGQVTFNPDVSIRIPRPVYTAVAINGTGRWRLNYGGIAYVDAPSLYPNDESGYVKLRYNSAGSTSNQTETHPFLPAFKLVPGVNAQVVTGTVLLSISGAQPWGEKHC